MNRNVILAALACLFLGLVGGCFWQYRSEQQTKNCTKQLFAMDTTMSFTACGKNSEAAVDAAIEEVKRLDALLSTGNPDSEVSWINTMGEGSLSEDTEELLERSLEFYRDTGGIFDITIYPVMQLWGFPTQEYHVPTEEELAAVLKLVDGSQVTLGSDSDSQNSPNRYVQLGEGQQIDLGGIAKGYTSSRVMEIYREYGITSGLVSLGGNVQTLGKKPDGTNWNIGIRDPEGSAGSVLAVLSVADKAVVTSGGYERYFEEDGTTYIHIIDPRTGYPADSDLVSVTVVSEDGTLADALSTSLYIMGLEDAADYWRTHGANFDLVLVTEEGKVYVTEGIQNDFRGEGVDAEEVEVIQR